MLVDIDHFAEKYGAGINDPPTVGHVIDVQAIIANNLAQVQALMIIHNFLMYNLVTRGLFKGNSVVDLTRKKVCNYTYKFERTVYLMNTLYLEDNLIQTVLFGLLQLVKKNMFAQ